MLKEQTGVTWVGRVCSGPNYITEVDAWISRHGNSTATTKLYDYLPEDDCHQSSRVGTGERCDIRSEEDGLHPFLEERNQGIEPPTPRERQRYPALRGDEGPRSYSRPTLEVPRTYDEGNGKGCISSTGPRSPQRPPTEGSPTTLRSNSGYTHGLRFPSLVSAYPQTEMECTGPSPTDRCPSHRRGLPHRCPACRGVRSSD